MHHPHAGVADHCARRPRHILAACLAAFLAAAASLLLVAAPAQAAPAPRGIDGDRQSSAVSSAAAAALHARDVAAYTRSPDAHSAYLVSLDATATAVAAEFGVDPAVVRAAWAAADLDHQTAMLAALSELGTEYRYATSSPGSSFDCSGLTAYAWSRAGFDLPHQSSAQIDRSPRVERAAAAGGDLVQYPGHVMMYLGFGNAIVHAANQRSDVELSNLRDGRSFRWADPSE